MYPAEGGMPICFGNSPVFGVILRLFPKHQRRIPVSLLLFLAPCYAISFQKSRKKRRTRFDSVQGKQWCGVTYFDKKLYASFAT